jgi:hypothetical protein
LLPKLIARRLLAHACHGDRGAHDLVSCKVPSDIRMAALSRDGIGQALTNLVT